MIEGGEIVIYSVRQYLSGGNLMKDNDFRKLKKIFKYYKPVLKYFFLAGFAIILITLISLPLPYLSMKIVDDVIIGNDFDMMKSIILVWIVLLLVKPLLMALKRYSLDLFELKFDLAVKEDIFTKIMYLPMQKVNRYQAGYIQSRIDSDVSVLHTVTASNILSIFANLVNLLFGLFMMLRVHEKLSVASIIIIPLAIANSFIFSKKMKFRHEEYLESWAIQRGNMYESISALETIKVLVMEKRRREEFSETYKKSIQVTMKRTLLEIISGFFTLVIHGTLPLVMWGYGSYLVINNELTLGQLMAFVGYSGFVFEPAIKLATLKLNFQGAMASWERIEEILSVADEQEENVKKLPLVVPNGEILFKDINFKFNQQDDYLLKQLNLHIKAGEKIAIIGGNGSGKSTLVKLILGLYPDYEGEIYLDGQRILDFNSFSIRKQIALVSQNIFLFKGTILENIKFSDPDISDLDVFATIKKYNLDKYFQFTPDGLNYSVTEGGTNLSGGQKQLIGIIRALVKKDSSIVIFDEATSALNPAVEKFLVENIDGICNGRTFINIAHRSSFIKNVDRVIALENGRITFEGSNSDFISCYSAIL